MRITWVAAIAIVSFFALLVPGAAGQSSDGATVLDFDVCEVYEPDGTVCFEYFQVLNITETPSGQQSITLHDRVHSTPSWPCGNEIQESYQAHDLILDDGSLQASGSVRQMRFGFTCDGVTISCNELATLRQVNGEVLFERFRSRCTEEAG